MPNIMQVRRTLLVPPSVSAVAPTSYATFDGTPTNATLSNGDLTVTHSNALYGGGRSNSQKSSGKFYFEVTAVANISASNQFIAVLTPATSYATASSAATGGGLVLQGGSGLVFANDASTGLTIGTITNGDIIGVAVDLDNEKVWFRKAPSGNWNGQVIGSQNPATNTGGGSLSNYSGTTLAPAVGFDATTSGAEWTANFGATAFTGTPPSGFTAGWTA